MPPLPVGKTYQFINNIEVENADNYSVSTVVPLGLVQGEYRFEVELNVPAAAICGTSTFATVKASGEIYLYKRVYSSGTPNPWVLTTNENNWGPTPPASYKIGQLVVSTLDTGSGPVYGPTQTLITSFTVEKDPTVKYEYAVVVKLMQDNAYTDMAYPTIRIYGRDANYTYSIPPALPVQPFSPPITTAYEYYTGVEEYDIIPPGETSAVPYLTQDAKIGTIYNSITNPIGSGTILPLDESVEIILTTFNEQIVPGLFYTCTGPSTPTFNGFVAGINVDNNPNKIALQLLSPYSGTVPGDLAGGNINAGTVTQTDPPSVGKLYANTEEGTEVRRFYTDSAFTQKWIPPVANRFYNFQTSKDYNPNNIIFGTSGALRYSKYPYYSAKFNADGEVIDQTAPIPNVQTSWEGQNNANTALITPVENYSYNMDYDSIP